MKLEILESPDANGVRDVRATVEDASDGTFIYGGRDPGDAQHQAAFFQRTLAVRRGQIEFVNGEPRLTGTLPPSYEVLPFMLKTYRIPGGIREVKK